MQLKASSSSFAPHPTGLYPAVCVDVIDLGMVLDDFQGKPKPSHKIRIVWETTEKKQDGTPYFLSRRYTASLHAKSRLTEMLSKWRGRPIQPDEVIDMENLIGANATLLIGESVSKDGRPLASIDAVTRPTRKLQPSGTYDPHEARRRIVEKTGATLPGYTPAQEPSSPEPEPESEAAEEALMAPNF